jgi:ABC-type multidrug transport system fused ATPase/permease subunit
MSDKIIQQEIRFTGKYSKSVFETLWLAYKPHRWIFAFCLVIGFTGRILLLSNANLIGVWVDTFCHTNELVRCRPVPVFFAHYSNIDFVKFLSILTGLGFFTTLTFRVIFSSLSAKAVSQIYDETTYRTSRFPLSFFDNTPAGRVVTRFSSDYGNVFRLFGGPLAEFLSIVFDLVGMIALVAIASPFYLAPIAVMSCFNFILFRLNREKLREARRELSASRSPSIAHFSETAQGAGTIRSFNQQLSFSGRFRKLDSYFLGQKRRVVKNVMFFSLQMNSLTALLLLLTGSMAFFLLQRGLVSIGSLGVAFGFITLSGNTVQMFFEWLTQFEEAMIGVERLDHYLRKDLEPGARLPSHAQFPTHHWKESRGEDQHAREGSLSQNYAVSVDFNNVWFRYSADLPYILKGVDFHIRPAEKFGIIGRTGSGKSSLIQALLSLYPTEKGEILIDGKKPKFTPDDSGEDLEVYRRAISFIAQDSILFKGNLKENLIVNPTQIQASTEEHLFKALRRVGLDAWATKEGLQMEIEEKGKNLSLGEKQLVCMARCLLQHAPVVIMDEATSSVDPKSEELLVRATQEIFLGRTQIIIAHRLSTLRQCDRILWLQNGEVKMIGSTEEVLKVFQNAELSSASEQ